MMRSLLALLVIAVPTVLPASPIAGGHCDTGTLAEFVALGDTGCTLSHDLRIFDISADLHETVDFSAVTFATDSWWAGQPAYSEATARSLPLGSTLTIQWDAPRPVTAARWYQFDSTGDLTFTPLPLTQTGTMTLTATIADAYLGFQLTQVLRTLPLDGGGPISVPPFTSVPSGTLSGVPEPSAFLPLLGIWLLMARYGVRKALSR